MKKWITSWVLDPKKFAKVNVYGTWLWIIMVPISVALGWVTSVAFVSALSIYALAGFHLSTYAAARTEILQSDADAKLQDTLNLLHEAVQRLQKLDDDHDRDSVDND